MENCGGYSKEPDYLTHGFEYQQQQSGGPRSAPLCNGTANGSPQGPKVPQNNNVLEESQHERKGVFSRCEETAGGQKRAFRLTAFLLLLSFSSSAGRAGNPAASSDDSFHKPVKLAGVTGDCEAELRQTLLSNGHTLRASQSESAPLRRASD